MNVKAVLSGRQSNDVDLDEDGFGARRLREGDVCGEMEKGSHERPIGDTNFTANLRFKRLSSAYVLPNTLSDSPSTAMALAGFLSSP